MPVSRSSCQTTRIGHHGTLTEPWVYGAFAIVGVLLSWLYLSAQVLLYAAEVNVVLARRLWPRSLLQSPLTRPDQQVLAALAQIEERLPRGDHRGQVLP